MSKKFQLKNGLKVLLLESHKSPVVSVQMWVRTGSADEKKGEEGISHFIEHLVFKGTRKYKMGEIASLVEGSGGELNAYTSFDQTVFYVTISKEYTDTALDVISEMMGFPQFDPQEIDNEREVVIEEIKRGNDSPGRRASQMLFKTAYKKHAYGLPVIGFDKVIKKIKPIKIKEYFHGRYCPRNMFLVVAGDINSVEMKKKVSQIFGEFKDYKLKKVSRKKEPKQTTSRIKIEKTDFSQSLGYLAWKVPSVRHKDIVALDVLALILGQGDSSRLTKSLRIDEPIVNSIGASNFTPVDEGVFTISFGYEKENLPKIFEKIQSEINDICQKAPSAEELQKAITCLASEQVYSVETVDGIARKAGGDEFYMGDHEYFKKFLKELYALRPEDIQKVAQKYFKHQTMNVCLSTNDKSKTPEVVAKKFVQNFKKQQLKKNNATKKIQFKLKKLHFASKLDDSKPNVQKFNFENGLTVLVREQKDSPTTSLRAAYMAGTRIETEDEVGLTEMFARTWTTATKNYSEEEINHKIDSMAAALSSFGGRNTAGLSAEFLTNYTDDMLELFSEALLRPTFDQSILEREKVILRNQMKARNDNPSQVCILQFLENIFRNHPYGRDPLGNEKSLESISQDSLFQYLKKISHPQNLTVCVVGDFNAKEMAEKIHKMSLHLPAGKRISVQHAPEAISENKVLFTHLDKEQSHIVLGYRGLTLTDKRRYALHILQSVLAGQGGRLFLELRDKNSLAYSVSPLHMEGIETGYFGAYIGCSPEKADKAISMMKDEFKKLVDKKITQDELERAQKYIIGRHDIDLQRKSSICHTILFDQIYGNDPEEGLNIAAKIKAVTPAEVQDLAEEIFKQNYVISIVGKSKPTQE